MNRWFGLMALVALSLAGCGKEPDRTAAVPVGQPPGPPSLQEQQPAAATITTAELDRVEKPGQAHRLALIVKTRNNPFFDPMIKAAEAEAKALGCELEVQAPAQESDKERQFALVQDVAARGVAAILIAPADSRGIVPALKQAQEKGILVINLDNRVDAATAQSAGLLLGGYVGADNEEGGRLAGKAMVDALPDGGDVAILEGIRGADNAEARRRGFTSAIARPSPPPGLQPPGPPGPPGVPGPPIGSAPIRVAASESAEWDTQRAYAKFQSMFAAHPNLKGLFCANDKMALGALQAIREAGWKGRLKVIGYDNIPDVKPFLKNGELYATIEQHPDLMGKYGVRMAVGVLGGTVQKGLESLVPLELIRSAAP